jgi:Protein of unknown function (DUF3617)
MRVRSTRFGTLTVLGCCALVSLSTNVRGADPMVPTPAAADFAELSSVQAGLWEYHRIVVTSDAARPRFARLRKCADPSNEIRTKMALLRNRDCQFAPPVLRDGGYISSWTCPTLKGPITFRHVLIVRDPTSYLSMSETRLGQRVIQQKMEARRLGDCPYRTSAAPAMSAKPSRPQTEK